ncbi:MAG: hypothetical protein GY944_23745 [bacterium]|nr:hypothetical protein [bacterium]
MALALCALPLFEAQAAEGRNVWRPVEVGFDAVIVRPLRLTTLMLGGVLLGPALLMSLPNGETTRDEAIEIFWTIPYEALLEQELGDF